MQVNTVLRMGTHGAFDQRSSQVEQALSRDGEGQNIGDRHGFPQVLGCKRKPCAADPLAGGEGLEGKEGEDEVKEFGYLKPL